MARLRSSSLQLGQQVRVPCLLAVHTQDLSLTPAETCAPTRSSTCMHSYTLSCVHSPDPWVCVISADVGTRASPNGGCLVLLSTVLKYILTQHRPLPRFLHL